LRRIADSGRVWDGVRGLGLGFQPERDAAVLRSLTGLERINETPAAEFWKEQDKAKE
jgi:hypothetical protein